MNETNDVSPTVTSLWVAHLVLCLRMVVPLVHPGEWQLAQAGMFMRLVKDGISNISVAYREWEPAPCWAKFSVNTIWKIHKVSQHYEVKRLLRAGNLIFNICTKGSGYPKFLLIYSIPEPGKWVNHFIKINFEGKRILNFNQGTEGSKIKQKANTQNSFCCLKSPLFLDLLGLNQHLGKWFALTQPWPLCKVNCVSIQPSNSPAGEHKESSEAATRTQDEVHVTHLYSHCFKHSVSLSTVLESYNPHNSFWIFLLPHPNETTIKKKKPVSLLATATILTPGLLFSNHPLTLSLLPSQSQQALIYFLFPWVLLFQNLRPMQWCHLQCFLMVFFHLPQHFWILLTLELALDSFLFLDNIPSYGYFTLSNLSVNGLLDSFTLCYDHHLCFFFSFFACGHTFSFLPSIFRIERLGPVLSLCLV